MFNFGSFVQCIFFRSFLLTTMSNAEREQNQELKKSRGRGASVAKNLRFWFRRHQTRFVQTVMTLFRNTKPDF